MRKAALGVVVVYGLLLSSLTFAQDSKPVNTFPLDKITPGMHGIAYTVFQGTTPESMDVEVLGVLKNANGPKGDIILVRLGGEKAQYTGVVAGMSGSPVYFDGKLAGAVAFRIGEFSKEPIAGVTPISEMLEISALDSTPTSVPVQAKSLPSLTSKTSGPGISSAPVQSFANYLKPIETPLVFSGFSEDAVQKFAGQFASQGIVPVMGVGSASSVKQPEPLVPGSAVSAVLVSGDMNIAATCTVTYLDATHLLACGHPLMQFGMVDLPMTKAQVLATLPSPLNAFKIVNATETVGSFVQDRHNGIMGEFGKTAEMIPVTLTIHGGTTPKVFHYQVLNNARLSPVAISTTVYNALHGVNEYGDETTYAMKGAITVGGFPEVKLEDMFSASADGMQPAAMMAASAIGGSFGRIYDNPYSTPDIKGLQLDFEVTNERRSARLESARTDISEARPGDEVTVEVLLRPYRGDAIIEHVPVRIPTSASKGSTLHILVSDGDMLDRLRHSPSGQRLDLASTIGVLNKQHVNNRVYVSVLEQDPEAMVADKVMPDLPLSVMNVMDGMRGTQDMTVLGESSVSETETKPLDYVVSGAQLLSVTIK
jgi:SpoIVB peptidase S55